MANYIKCPDGFLVVSNQNYPICEDLAGNSVWVIQTQAESDSYVLGIVQAYNQSAMTIQDLIINIDPAIVEAIFGGALLLFVTGLGAGWLVNIVKQARL